MTEYQCWFCGQGIDRSDSGAVMVTVESLRRWAAGRRDDDDPWQSFFAHTACAKERLAGATVELERHIFGEDD